MTPRYSAPILTKDGLEPCWGINYLANFHLLSILSPAIRAQPADRDVRVVFAACGSYVGGELKGMRDDRAPLPKGREYATSKLALMVFASAFQRHLEALGRAEKQPVNARVVLVDPGAVRTPGMRRFLSMGTLWGLFVYVALWPLWWLVLKSADMGAEGFLRAVMEAELGRGAGGKFLREGMEVQAVRGEVLVAVLGWVAVGLFLREGMDVQALWGEVKDEKVAEELWKFSERQIVALEKEGAVKRALAKKEKEKNGVEKKGEGLATSGAAAAPAPAPDTARSSKTPGSRRSRKTG